MSGSIITVFNEFGDLFCENALAMLVQSSILILVLLVIDLLLRKRTRAVFRYCIWLLVFVKLAIPPTFSLPTGIGYWRGDYVRTDSITVETISMPAVDHAKTPMTTHSVASSELPPVRPAGSVEIPVAEASVAGPASPSISWQAVILLGWFLGVLVLVVVLMKRAWFVRSLIAQSEPAEGKLTDILSDCCLQLGMRKSVELRISHSLLSSAVCGLFESRIMLSSSLLGHFSSDRLRTVLLHELAHIKRGDLWVNSLQTALQIVYFYNPLLWLANAITRRAREQAVDEMVLVCLGDKANTYSSTLVDIAEIAFARPTPSLHLMGVVQSKKVLAKRIEHIVNRPLPKSAQLGFTGLLAIFITSAVMLPMAKAQMDMDLVEVGQIGGHFTAMLPDGVEVKQAGTETQQLSQVQSQEDLELPEITTRMESAERLKRLGLALTMFADDHDEKYPASLHHLSEYLNVQELAWALANVKYLAHGKTIANRPDTVAAYDTKLLREGKGTNVLYSDCHVSFGKPEELHELGISAAHILIDMKLLSTDEGFIDSIGLDTNSVSGSDAWSEHLAPQSGGPNNEMYSLILDQLHVNLLLNTVHACQDSRILASLQVLCRAGEKARMTIGAEKYYVLGYDELNLPPDEPETQFDTTDIGTSIWLTPEPTPDSQNVCLDLKLEMRQLIGGEEHRHKGIYKYIVPRTEVVSTELPCLIPKGKTLLVVGVRMPEQGKERRVLPSARDLPLVGAVLGLCSNDKVKDHKILLVLIKPVLDPQQEATTVLPGHGDFEDGDAH